MKIKSINPYTGEVNDEFDLLDLDQAASEIARSREAYSAWRDVPVADRANLLKAVAAELKSNRREYAEIMTREMGKPIRESYAEVDKCALLCDYYRENGPKFLRPEQVPTGYDGSYVSFEPLGVVLAVMPWNFPLWQVFRFAVPALTAGNAGLLKHASNVPISALAIERIFSKAGYPENVFKTLLMDSGTTMKVIDQDLVDAVSLTGSNPAGEAVGELAGKRIKPMVLELGGSDPFVVLDDANVEAAAAMAVKARMINAGQSCIAAKRFIVMRDVAQRFEQAFIEHLGKLKVGDPMDESTDIGPVASSRFKEELEEQLADAEAKGGRVVKAPPPTTADPGGNLFTPCAVTNVTPDMKIITEEVFGPIAPIIIVNTEEEAVQQANATEFGLGAAIWSGDTARAQRLARRIETGFVAINDMVKSDPRLPFGGVKKSGVGRELSHYGMKEFVNIKAVVVNKSPK
ncbi:NAD-dependent succinate-semialdehyde dehydrogenase [candidate division KSB1 bacterium]